MLTRINSTDYRSGQLTEKEWLETNGLGGWSSSTLTFMNTRRYHGLLVAAVHVPTEREVLVSRWEESLITDGDPLQLAHNHYGDVVFPRGDLHFREMNLGLCPEFVYAGDNWELRKRVLMLQGRNTVLMEYTWTGEQPEITLECTPLLACRGSHQIRSAGGFPAGEWINQGDQVCWQTGRYPVYLYAPSGHWEEQRDWYYRTWYPLEAERGLEDREDLFTPGRVRLSLKRGQACYVALSMEDVQQLDLADLFRAELVRREQLLDPSRSALENRLRLAADQFIVRREPAGKTIIAGYPWFTDWGRDTMISLPGLCLATGRLQDARDILLAFLPHVDQGMVPNRFPEGDERPEYNNVDGTLWYFLAVYHYWLAAGKPREIVDTFVPVFLDIMDWHVRGTRYRIRIDENDGLLDSGEEGVQLTWMDARIGDWVVTPRRGKPIEIQALWYNALCITSLFLSESGQPLLSDAYGQRALRVRDEVKKQFWSADRGYLLDVVGASGSDDSLRPNQLFALSLPFVLLEGEPARRILERVHEELLVPGALRTLPARDRRYAARYLGNPLQRDSIYHQGTAWTWLLGAFADAAVRHMPEPGPYIQDIPDHVSRHVMWEGCIGSVSEILDADKPHTPRGCCAQAWGVGELLRILHHYENYFSAGASKAAAASVA